MARAGAPVLEAAIEWMVLLRSGEATAAEHRRFEAWLQAHEAHRDAWGQVQGAVRQAVVPLAAQGPGPAREAAHGALLRPARRRVLRDVLGWGATAVVAAWLLERQWPLEVLRAGVRTGTGERREIALEDGSRLTLNARTALDVDYGADRRRVRLHAGELIADVQADAARPFAVWTAEGSVQALGTRFLVRQEEGRTLAMVLAHRVRLQPRDGAARELEQGQSAYFSRTAIEAPGPAGAGMASWAQGMLVADDQPLAEVIEALRPYREGVIRLSPEVARLRVLGAFALADPDRLLDSLAQTLPIRVRRYGPWLVVIEGRDA